MTQLLASKPVVEEIKKNLKKNAAEFKQKYGRAPSLSVVLVGDDPASVIYTRKKGETAGELGFDHETIVLPVNSTPEKVHAIIDSLNKNPKVDGILVQRPLPKTFNEEEVVFWVQPDKDVDAFHPESAGRLALGLPCFQPCTPAGVMKLLKHYNIEIAGKVACIIGRSSIVGKPMAALMLQANATIIQCHTKTKNLPEMCRQADIVIVAAGKPQIVDASYIREGAVVVDVGIHRDSQNKVVGDVKFDSVQPKASAITPVPGGVGPMTIMVLLENTLRAAQQREEALMTKSRKDV